MPVTFITDGDTTIIESTDSDMLNFVGLILIDDFGYVKNTLYIPTTELSKAQQYIALWYETVAEAKTLKHRRSIVKLGEKRYVTIGLSSS